MGLGTCALRNSQKVRAESLRLDAGERQKTRAQRTVRKGCLVFCSTRLSVSVCATSSSKNPPRSLLEG